MQIEAYKAYLRDFANMPEPFAADDEEGLGSSCRQQCLLQGGE